MAQTCLLAIYEPEQAMYYGPFELDSLAAYQMLVLEVAEYNELAQKIAIGAAPDCCYTKICTANLRSRKALKMSGTKKICG